MPNGAEHEPGNHWGTVLAIGTGVLSMWRALRGKRPEIDKDEELDSAATRGSRRATILTRQDEADIRLDRLDAGRARNEAGIERLERLIGDLRNDFLTELDRQVRRLRQEIDDKCSGSTGHNNKS